MLIVITGDAPNARLGNRRWKAFRWLAKAAAKESCDLYLVTPNGVLLKDGLPHQISGWRSNSSETKWESVRIAVQNPIWIDLMYLRDLKRLRGRYRRLKSAIERSGAPCVNPVLPPKNIIYRRLLETKSTAQLVPKTVPVRQATDIHLFLAHERIGWLKPVYGSGGRNIIRIERLGDGTFRLQSDSLNQKRLAKTLSRTELNRLLDRLFERRLYVMQEEISLPRTADGRRFDIRVTVQRNKRGKWQVTATTLRRSGEGAIVTNYHGGGTHTSWPSSTAAAWLHQASLTNADVQEAQSAALLAAETLQQHHPWLAFLGVDVAPTPDGCFVYDCNSRPGRDILTDHELQRMMQRLAGFAAYVSANKTKLPE